MFYIVTHVPFPHTPSYCTDSTWILKRGTSLSLGRRDPSCRNIPPRACGKKHISITDIFTLIQPDMVLQPTTSLTIQISTHFRKYTPSTHILQLR